MYIRLIKDVTEQGGDMTPAGTILSLRRSEGEPFEEDFKVFKGGRNPKFYRLYVGQYERSDFKKVELWYRDLDNSLYHITMDVVGVPIPKNPYEFFHGNIVDWLSRSEDSDNLCREGQKVSVLMALHLDFLEFMETKNVFNVNVQHIENAAIRPAMFHITVAMLNKSGGSHE